MLSTLLLLNSTAIFGAFDGEQHLIKVGIDDMLTTSILFLLLVRFNDIVYLSGGLEY